MQQADSDPADPPRRSTGTDPERSQRVVVPAEASLHEAAAITACVRAHLRGEALAAARVEDGSADRSRPERDDFRFAGRAAALTGAARRRPAEAPTDDWTALERLRRF